MGKYGVFALLMFSSTLAQAALREQTVHYSSGGTPLQGYIVWDDALEGKRPGILVVHEFWGLNDYARARARQLAELGYTAMAVDMYGSGRSATHPADASAFMQSVMSRAGVMKRRFIAAEAVLQQEDSVDPENIAAIGYCFGGHVVLQMAREGVPLKAVASFHGLLTTQRPAQSGQVSAKVAAFNGAEDAMVTTDQIAAFKQEMEAAGVDYTFVNYPGAKHGFTNPAADNVARDFDMPVAYNAEADKDSWQQLQRLLRRAFGH